MYIYYARAIRNVGNDEIMAQHQRNSDIKDLLKRLKCRPQFDLHPDCKREDFDDFDTYIYYRDLNWIQKCKAMVADVTVVSAGVGYEVAFAEHSVKIPVLKIAEKDQHVSAMYRGHRPIYYYRDWADAEYAITEFIKEVLGLEP